jgi:chromatin remodeling complex protein RSC6
MAAKRKKKAAKRKAAKKTAKRKATKRKGAKKKATKKKATKKKATKRKAAKKKATKKAAKKKTAKKKSKRKPNPAFMRPLQPDPALAAVVGPGGMPRTEVTKKVWTYIKRKGLQDAKNRRMINADDKLRPVFNGKSQVSMFEMTKLINNHLS